MSHGRFKNPLEAALTGIKDIFRKQSLAAKFLESDRLEGKTCLVTGANSGLGYAVAVQLAQRGARVLMACRSGIPEAGEKVKQESGSQNVEMLKVDLSDLTSIDALCQTLKERDEVLDVVVCNAGFVAPKSQQAPQGLDTMFMVNYLAKFILLNKLLKQGTIPNQTFSDNGRQETRPRIIFVSSDSHQGASAIDWDEFGTYYEYGVNKAINNYSYFKLVMNTLAMVFSRQLVREDGSPDVGVIVMCPGPVNTNIIRRAPWVLRMMLKGIFSLFFQTPQKAARPVIYLAASADFEGETGIYLHMFNPKKMDPKCYDEAEGKKLWERSQDVWDEAKASTTKASKVAD